MSKLPSTPKERRTKFLRLSLIALIVLVTLRLLFPVAGPVPATEPLSRLVSDITAHHVAKIVVNDQTQQITATYKDGKVFTTGYPLGYGAQLVERYSGDVAIKVSPITPASPWSGMLLSLFEIGLIIGAMAFFLRGSLKGKVPGLSSIKNTPDTVPATRFVDVGGVDEIVTELTEVVDYLHSPDKYQKLGAKVPHGILLVGPPGTGKTLLAKAVAGEAGVPFFALSGSDFVETFVGVGASRVRSVFKEARKAGKAIIFIDELDAVGRNRGSGPSNGASEESDRTLNALLVEMDGFGDSSVMVLGATNRPEVLDSALLRSGRFDRKITVGAPDRKGREQILKLLLKNKVTASDVDAWAMAGRTSSLTGADLAYLVNEAAMQAAREGASAITQSHLIQALEVVAIGRARTSMVVSDEERRLTAYHEAGHAVASLVLEAADDPVLVSIVPRGGAGGVTWMEGDDNNFVSRARADAQMTVCMAGRAGEMMLVGDNFTSGVSGDLREAGKIATAMVTQWAMSDLGAHFSQVHLNHEISDREVAEIDRLIDAALSRAQALLSEYADLHQAITDAVLENDVVDAATLRSLYEQYAPARV